ncbi:MAG: hypothetical protein FWH42_02840 [Dehalococcoidia bacterium]|nr:hypothetical protein [Dehalococcoidia bacterium]
MPKRIRHFIIGPIFLKAGIDVGILARKYFARADEVLFGNCWSEILRLTGSLVDNKAGIFTE